MTPAPITIVIADDHPVYRMGLIRALSQRPDYKVLAELGDGRAALEAMETLAPDVAVLDNAMPLMPGVEVIRAARTRGLATATLLLTGSEDPHSLYNALAAGAAGYVLKTAPLDDVCDAIAAVARGEVRVPAELLGSLAADIRAREHLTSSPLLADREREVISLTAAGRSAAEIAGDLHLSLATVRTHLQNAYAKLEVSDRAAAVAKAMRLGLID